MSIEMIGVDVGGTFTDIVGIDSGRIRVAKVPTDPSASEQAVLIGAEELGVGDAQMFNLASTAGLNAVITRRLPKVAFLTTLGFRDILDKGRLIRPIAALTDMSWRRGFGDASGRPLVPRYLRRGIRERMTARGEVVIPLDEEQAREELRRLKRCNVEGVAICLINAYVDGRHERRLRELVAEELGDVPCSISSEVSPLAREYLRASTTTVDAIMKLKYGEYTTRLDAGLRKLGFSGQFNYADCSARLMPAAYAMERPYHIAVGGPAAGTLSCMHFGALIGDSNMICADVGGTSCDISVVIDGKRWVNSTFELEYDLGVNAISTDIITLGAGGGSIISISPTGDIQSGPDSAGGHPGPACYGQGGTRPTVTDAALLMGILAPDRFLGGRKLLKPELAETAFNRLDKTLSFGKRVQSAWRMSQNNIAEGLLNIAIRRGIDVREFSLVAFGAAGPMLLPGLLDQIPLRRIIVPPHPGLFSALGLLSSDQAYTDTRCLYSVLTPEVAPAINELFLSMEAGLLARSGIDRDRVRFLRHFDGRLVGQSWETPFVEVPGGPITAESIGQMIATFHDVYEQRNGNRFTEFPVQGVSYRVEMVVPTRKVEYEKILPGDGCAPVSRNSIALHYLYDGDLQAKEYERCDLREGDRIVGPAIVHEPMSTTFVPAGRTLTTGGYGELLIA